MEFFWVRVAKVYENSTVDVCNLETGLPVSSHDRFVLVRSLVVTLQKTYNYVVKTKQKFSHWLFTIYLKLMFNLFIDSTPKVRVPLRGSNVQHRRNDCSGKRIRKLLLSFFVHLRTYFSLFMRSFKVFAFVRRTSASKNFKTRNDYERIRKNISSLG